MTADGQRPPATGSAGHYDLETLALLDAEAFEPPAAERIRAHTSDCAVCGSALAALRAVRAELAALPTPQLPAGVAGRLDAAVEAERRARFGPAPLRPTNPADRPDRLDRPASRQHPAAAPPGTVGGSTPGTVSDMGARRLRRRGLARVSGWVAAAAVLLGSAGLGTAALRGSAGTQAGHPNAGAAPSPALTGTGPGSSQPLVPSHPLTPRGTGTGGTGVPQYTRDDIGARLSRILAQATCGGANRCGAGSTGILPDTDRARCTAEVDKLAGVRGDPTAMQFALFEGQPAYVYIFGTDQIVVVGSDCGQSAAPKVLFSSP